MSIVLFDPIYYKTLFPLTLTRPAGDLRCGIIKLNEKWEKLTGHNVSHLTRSPLDQKFSSESDEAAIYVLGSILPNEKLWAEIKALPEESVLVKSGELVAFKTAQKMAFDQLSSLSLNSTEATAEYDQLTHPWDVFLKNGAQIRADIELMKLSANSSDLSDTNMILGDEVYVQEGVSIEGCILNAKEGPIYLGKGSTVMEGSVIRGPFALGESATIKMSSKVYGDTTIGPHCKVGGEVSNVVFHGYSNKGHDGFLGNSVVGEWCNLGADTNSSNLKNNYGPVRVWSYENESQIDSGQQFCGLIMGDHSKTGINTMLNTGTVAGVAANVFDSGFPPKFIPSFSWGGKDGFETFKLEKAYEVAERMMERRGVALTEADKNILLEAYNADARFRG